MNLKGEKYQVASLYCVMCDCGCVRVWACRVAPVMAWAGARDRRVISFSRLSHFTYTLCQAIVMNYYLFLLRKFDTTITVLFVFK